MIKMLPVRDMTRRTGGHVGTRHPDAKLPTGQVARPYSGSHSGPSLFCCCFLMGWCSQPPPLPPESPRAPPPRAHLAEPPAALPRHQRQAVVQQLHRQEHGFGGGGSYGGGYGGRRCGGVGGDVEAWGQEMWRRGGRRYGGVGVARLKQWARCGGTGGCGGRR